MKPIILSYEKVTVGVELLSEGGSCARKLVRHKDSEDLRPNHQQHNDAGPLHSSENGREERWEAHRAGSGCGVCLGILTGDDGW